MRRASPPPPPVTDAHRRAGWQLLAMRGCTYEQALQDPIRRRLIECAAKTIRNREAAAARHQPPSRTLEFLP